MTTLEKLEARVAALEAALAIKPPGADPLKRLSVIAKERGIPLASLRRAVRRRHLVAHRPDLRWYYATDAAVDWWLQKRATKA